MATVVQEVWTARSLVWNFAQRDLRSRYKRSALGWTWSLINPITTLLVFTVVFSTIFRAEPPALGNGSAGSYSIFLFSGLVLWNFFSNTINGSMQSLIAVGPLLRKIYFPPFAPVAGGVVAAAVQTGIEVSILLAVLVAIGNVSWTFLLMPYVLVMLALFATGIGLFLSVYNVYFRDVSYLVGVALQVLFYATPIIYPPSLVPEQAYGLPLRSLFELNPIGQYVEAFRNCVYDLTAPSLSQLAVLTAMSVVSATVGWVVFHRRARDVSEEL